MHSLLTIKRMQHMIVLQIVSLLIITSTAQAEYPPKEYTEDGCFIVKRYKNAGNSIPIQKHTSESGRYCLGQDFIQRRVWSIDDGQERGDPQQKGIISIGASDTELDMRGHLLRGKPYDNVLGISTWWSEPRDANGRLHLKNNPTQFLGHLHIHSGRIEVKGPGAVGTDLAKPYANLTIHFNSKLSHDDASKDDDKIGILPEENTFEFKMVRIERDSRFWLENYPFGLTDNYPNTQHVIENMSIHAGGRAIIIAGAGNTIRNSVLEVDGDTSVLSYGPDTIIEGNTFIIHLDKKNPKGELPAALKLRHANRAIVRNNKFIVKKGLFNSSKAEFAINLSDSNGVIIEGNTIEGFENLVRENGDTSYTENNNTKK